MRRNSNLPSLSTNKNSQSKGSIRNIEQKISYHENEITRNQKVILALTNDFRLFREQLKVKEQENQELSQMYAKVVEELQLQNKNNKQLKIHITKLEKSVEDKEKRLSEVSPQNLKKIKDFNVEILGLKKLCDLKDEQYKILQSNYDRLMSENDKLKEEVKKKNKQIQEDGRLARRILSMEKEIEKLTQKLKDSHLFVLRLEEEKKDISQQLYRMKEYADDKDRIIRENGKNQKKMRELQVQNKEVKEQNSRIKERLTEMDKRIKSKQGVEDKIGQFIQKLKQIENQNRKYKESATAHHNEYKTLQNLYKRLKQQHTLITGSNEKLNKLTNFSKKLHRTAQLLGQSIKCELCKKITIKPVTNIPCGHSYCLECKKGYEKECRRCPGMKRDAVYRNQLLDEVITAFEQINSIINLLS